MKLTHQQTGLGLVVLAGLMLGSAAVADNMGMMGMGGRGMASFDFAAMDADKDGKISEAEVTAYRAAQVTAMDTNADGKLSVEELAAMHIKAMTETSNDMAQRMIDRLDTDGDKVLSAAELAARPMKGNLFARVDANSDGFIDQAEVDAAKQAMNDRGGRHGKGGRHGGRGHDDMDAN